MQKICKACGRTLDISKFTKSKNTKDGYENKCKECRLEQRKKYINTCEICGKTFKTANKNAKYCSTKCIGEFRKNRVGITCSYCGKKLKIKKSNFNKYEHHYCDLKCRDKHLTQLMQGSNNHNYNRVEYICDGCGKKIYVIPSKIKKQKYIFCSKECYKKNYGKFIYGEKHPNYIRQKCICNNCGKEFYRKPSQIRTQNVYCSEKCHVEAFIKYNKQRSNKIYYNCDYCGKLITIWPSELKNKKHIYCSKKCKDKGVSKYYSGENHPCWDNTKTQEERIISRKYPEYNIWRSEVYKKDNYTCQCCGDNNGGNLNAHHIFNYMEYKELRTDIKNGITLCDSCHKDFHDTYGYTKNNKKQLIEFLKQHI